jgi:hypothetical protein
MLGVALHLSSQDLSLRDIAGRVESGSRGALPRPSTGLLRSAALAERWQEACIRTRTVLLPSCGRVSPPALAARGMFWRVTLNHHCSHSSGAATAGDASLTTASCRRSRASLPASMPPPFVFAIRVSG